MNLAKVLLVVSLVFCACQRNDIDDTKEPPTSSIEKVEVKELVNDVISNKTTYDKKEVKLTANFKFSHQTGQCLGECSTSIAQDSYLNSDTYLFQDFYLCSNKNETVLVDAENNKIIINNFPKYVIKTSCLDSEDVIELTLKDLELKGKVFYTKTFNHCEGTKHPSLSIELDAKTIANFVEKIDCIILDK